MKDFDQQFWIFKKEHPKIFQALKMYVKNLTTDDLQDNLDIVITDAVESTRKQEREFWKRDKELALKSVLDKIWSIKFREIENYEDMNNYNNKKLGFYAAIKQAKSAIESLLNSPNIER